MSNLTDQCQGSENDFAFSAIDSILAGSAATFLAFLGMTFNLITIFSLLNHLPLRKHVTTPFVISLAVSDFMFSTCILPIMAIRFYSMDWTLGEGMCQLFPLLFYGNTAVTLFNIMVVTVNRWCMIFMPYKSEKLFSRNKSKLAIAIVWIAPVIIMIPSLTGLWGRHELECKPRSCTILDDDGSKLPFKKFLYGIGIAIPTMILVVSNLMIYFKVRAMSKSLKRQSSDACIPQSLKKKEKQLTKMLFIIFVCFMLTYLPAFVVKRFDEDYERPTAHVLCYIINWLSVIVNPVIYVVTNGKYRLAVCLLYKRVRFFKNPQKYRQELELSNRKMSVVVRSSARPSFSRQPSVDTSVPKS